CSERLRRLLETQAFLLQELVRGPLQLGECLDPLLQAPAETEGVHEVVGGRRRRHRLVGHAVALGRSPREEAALPTPSSSLVGEQAARDGKGPWQHRGACYERSASSVHVQERLLHQILRSRGIPRGLTQKTQQTRRDRIV